MTHGAKGHTAGHTSEPWHMPEWMGLPAHIEEAKKHGIEPVPALDNQGARYIMAPDGDSGNKRVALVDCQTQFKRGKGHETNCPEREANARRIVACVNACAGIPDPAQLRAQRDDLLAVCTNLLTQACKYGPEDDASWRVREAARAAIAKAKAGGGS